MQVCWRKDNTLLFENLESLNIAVLQSGRRDYDLLILTGSRYGVYEDHDWIAPLEDLIREAYAKEIKMLGICFGHQIIAQALGGTVVKSKNGLGAGVMDYVLTDKNNTIKTVSLCAWHQDQVITPPAEAVTLATSDFCPHAALRYKNKVLSFQPHPEFSKDFIQGLIDLRRGKTITEDFAQSSEATLKKDTHAHIIQSLIADYLR